MSKKKTTQQFIIEAKEVHGNKYDYSQVNYIGNKVPVIINCPIHGPFNKSPIKHLMGQGCPKCSSELVHIYQRKSDEFFEIAKIIHKNKYDYSHVNYKNTREKVEIICKKHGPFWQEPMVHIRGVGCPKCARQELGQDYLLSTEDFIKKANKIHNNMYTYSKSIYKGAWRNIIITCPVHGDFIQKAHNHLCGRGCPKCKYSKGEKAIMAFLDSNNIPYEGQKKFIDLKLNKPLRYDFWLPNYNLLIEYNGEQHYRPIKHFGGLKKFIKQYQRDKLKIKYAKKNKIKLLVIKYTEYNRINDILKSILM